MPLLHYLCLLAYPVSVHPPGCLTPEYLETTVPFYTAEFPFINNK
jgi:hypothetical protein